MSFKVMHILISVHNGYFNLAFMTTSVSPQGSFTVMGVISGPLLGAFILGMFIPACNTVVSPSEYE